MGLDGHWVEYDGIWEQSLKLVLYHSWYVFESCGLSLAYQAFTARSTSPKTLINKKAYLITKGIWVTIKKVYKMPFY
jgi:hypothetical protein